MNKYTQRLALYLIDRRIKKIHNEAFKKLQKAPVVRKATIGDYIDDPQAYADLRVLRANIATINNPWQGVFATYWKLDPKNKKHIHEFPEKEWSPKVVLPPLAPFDQEWADLTEEEFIENLDIEEARWNESN